MYFVLIFSVMIQLLAATHNKDASTIICSFIKRQRKTVVETVVGVVVVAAIIRRTFSFQISNGDNGSAEEPDVAMLLA